MSIPWRSVFSRFSETSLRTNPSARMLGWISLPFYPLFCLFIMDYMNYGTLEDMQEKFWSEHPGSVLFEILVVALLFFVMLLLFRRVWICALIAGVLACLCGYINYMKVALNGDNFYPHDLAMAGQTGELLSFLSGNVPSAFFVCVAVVLIWTALFWALELVFPWSVSWRWSTAGLLILYMFGIARNPVSVEACLKGFGMSSFDSALQSSNYEANGFVGAFTINVLNMKLREPDGYDRQTVTNLLEQYPAVPADPDAEPFDVVLILSESFFDARTLPGVTFSENPLPHYDQLRKNARCWSGKFYSTALGGGTVRPEFSVLTGLTTDYLPNVTTPYSYVHRKIPTYVSNYKDAGYTTLAVHPYKKKFYSRDAAYPYLGFDAFYGEDEVAELVEAEYKRHLATDETTFRAIQTLVDAQENPTFLFAITMQNHQPYHALLEEEIAIQVDAPALSEAALTALTTYTQGLADADKMLGLLQEWIDRRERPTALVFFGDHLPTLGSNTMQAYQESGFINVNDGLDANELHMLYSTPFLIYSNRELSGGLFEKHTGNSLSDYNLLNTLARATGMARTPYMELLANFYETTPVCNVNLYVKKVPEITAFTQAMEMVTYDRIAGKRWSE